MTDNIDGRTREGRALRAAQEQVAERGDIVGRNGEVLSRKRQSGVDPYHIPDDMVPPDWSYQWNTVMVIGNADVVIDQTNAMYENGWRPVPAERHPGKFVPRGRTGDIVRGGLRLEERPLALTQQAREDGIRVAKQQMRDRDQALMGRKTNLLGSMADGFSMDSGRYRGAGGRLQMSIDPGLDIPSPSHQVSKE